MSSMFCHQEFEVVRKQLRKYIIIHQAHAIKIVIEERDYSFSPQNIRKYIG